MNNVIGKNNMIYTIAAVVLAIQGLACFSLVKSGIMILNYALNSWIAVGIQIGWGVGFILCGLLGAIGFIVMAIAAFMRSKNVAGVGAGIIAASYLFAVIREVFKACLYSGIGFVILNLICMAIMVAITLIAFADIKKLNDFAINKNILAIVILIALLVVTLAVASMSGLSASTVFFNTLETAGQIAALIVVTTLVVDNKNKGGIGMSNNNFDSQRTVYNEDGYRDVAMVVIFSIITFGIYTLYWVYKISEKMNNELRTGKSQVVQLLLYMFVPFYSWYWYYKETENLCIYGRGRGKNPDEGMAVVNLILAVIGLAIVGIALMQDMLNKIVDGNCVAYSSERQNAYVNNGNGYGYNGYEYVEPKTSSQPKANPVEPEMQPETQAEPVEPEMQTEMQPEPEYEPAMQATEAESDDSAQDIIENLQAELQTDADTYDDPIEQYLYDEKSAKNEEPDLLDDEQPVAGIPYRELKKLKELLDEDIITQSEFEQLKQKFMK